MRPLSLTHFTPLLVRSTRNRNYLANQNVAQRCKNDYQGSLFPYGEENKLYKVKLFIMINCFCLRLEKHFHWLPKGRGCVLWNSEIHVWEIYWKNWCAFWQKTVGSFVSIEKQYSENKQKIVISVIWFRKGGYLETWTVACAREQSSTSCFKNKCSSIDVRKTEKINMKRRIIKWAEADERITC